MSLLGVAWFPTVLAVCVLEPVVVAWRQHRWLLAMISSLWLGAAVWLWTQVGLVWHTPLVGQRWLDVPVAVVAWLLVIGVAMLPWRVWLLIVRVRQARPVSG